MIVIAQLLVRILELKEELVGLKLGKDCWCAMAVGHPLQHEHSAPCKRIQALLKKPITL